jgi:glycosyltransferase involved in cell wall biosynthesis
LKIAFLLPSILNKGSITIFKEIIQNIIAEYKEIEIDLYYFKSYDKEYFNFDDAKKLNFLNRIEFDKYDIIHSSGFIPNLYIALFRWRSKSIFITTIHSYLEEDIKNSFKGIKAIIIYRLWLKILNFQNGVVVLTNHAKSYYDSRINVRIDAINNGISIEDKSIIKSDDLHEINKIKLLKEKYKLIGTNAVLSRIKGLDQVIQSLVKLKDYCFIVVGDGPELSNLKEYAEELNVLNRCLFLGYKENVRAYTEYYDLYVMPSRSEGFGLALIEAISMKIPCLCSNLPVFNELFSSKEVLFFELENIEDFIEKVILSQTIQNSLIESAYIRFTNNYTSSVMTKNYVNLYRNYIYENQ